ncbi:hypothetical protein [Burkholderia sp. BE17]|uniref:hypothetical protein n=1 Tax=Burkholderia sp. BE17 TaxID=2656644 RepID=UPI00128CC6E1|nr:hypothetical protein [Burkholderia sp. BE17]MPV71730.1 hypothetical protein [Burkholderia sp. BE17]
MTMTEKKHEHAANHTWPPWQPSRRRTQLKSQFVVHFTTAAYVANGPFVNPGPNAEHSRRFLESESGAHFSERDVVEIYREHAQHKEPAPAETAPKRELIDRPTSQSGRDRHV